MLRLQAKASVWNFVFTGSKVNKIIFFPERPWLALLVAMIPDFILLHVMGLFLYPLKTSEKVL